jgi:phosphoinositide-3-kinase, regulatory subunit 4
MLITFLNSKEWLLRYSFFEKISEIAIYVGPTSLKEFILPCISQALYDVEESVIESALKGLVVLTELKLFKKAVILDLLKTIVQLLHHPNKWIRYYYNIKLKI